MVVGGCRGVAVKRKAAESLKLNCPREQGEGWGGREKPPRKGTPSPLKILQLLASLSWQGCRV